jgi:hypothetical protein
MRLSGARKQFLLAFLSALVLYAVSYNWIEHLRTRKGPWEVRYGHTMDQAPHLIIDQRSLSISNVEITFPGQICPLTNLVIAFAQPQPVPYEMPYGQCVFMDTTFLPGTVTLRLFGHEIELLPRVLIIDRKEHPWKTGDTIRLAPTSTSGSTKTKS